MGAHSRPRFGPDGARGRHRGQSAPLIEVDLAAAARRTGTVLAAGAVAATVVVGGSGGALAAGTSPARPAATAADFAALRQCESGGNYAIDTGNGYYGAYQFDIGTWQGLGYPGLPSAAPAAVQDQAAERLQAARGWSPWPGCSAKLGLGRTPAPTAVPTATALRSISRAWVRSVTPAANVHLVPAFGGTTLSTALEPYVRSDVRTWQTQMVVRGWHLSVDGSFGPGSAQVARQFAADKGLRTTSGALDTSGSVGRDAWLAAWITPITP